MVASLVGIHQLAVDGNLVDAIVSLNKFGLKAEFVFYGSRQTGGHGQKASLYTVGDLNTEGLLFGGTVHAGFPYFWMYYLKI
jgi:hypothetical protein